MDTIFYLSSCSTCNRIIKEFELKKYLKMREIKSEPVSEVELDQMHQLSGSYEALFSRRAIKFRELGLKARKLIESDYKKLILEEYTFLKRPVIIIGGEIFIGNSKKVIASMAEKLKS